MRLTIYRALLATTVLCIAALCNHKPALATCGSIPNVFTENVSIVSATTTNANNSFLLSCATTVDNTQIGSLGIFASQIKPTTTGQATFGGTLGYVFGPFASAQVPVTINGASGQSVDLYDVLLFSGTKVVWIDSSGVLHTNQSIVTPGLTISGLTASGPVCTDGSKNLTSTCTGLIPNAALVNSSLTVTAGTGLSGCGLISLGGSCTLTTANIPNASLANSTISGVALGGTLFTLTFGTHLTGSAYNGGGPVTIATDCTSNPGVASKLFCTDASGNGTLQAFSATTVQINGAGLFNEPGAGTTVASIGCSLWGVKSGGTQELCADTSGNVGLAGSLYMASSRSLKRDIVPLGDALSIMRSLRIVKFNYRVEPIGMDAHVGIIADDAPAIIAGKAHKHEDIASLVGVNSRVIQQLMAKVDSLENQVHALKARLRK